MAVLYLPLGPAASAGLPARRPAAAQASPILTPVFCKGQPRAMIRATLLTPVSYRVTMAVEQ
ncbi:hypothetical protein [Sphingomonas sp. GM_Shp_2]|uniref:hypothetical protein n=1 Tax=Sphingomonas sp. GM_Shp_2 TaxID=2937380 RepID=UPI00226AE8C5|nr:hypothetical protein [Sphingomonas sp. GM_Shp_2]